MLNGSQGIAKGQSQPIKEVVELNRREAPVNVSVPLFNVGVGIAKDGLTKRYARQYEESKAGILSGSNSFEEILQADKESPIINSIFNQGRIDGARVAQSVNMKLAFREEIEEAAKEQVGFDAEGFAKYLDTKFEGYLTGDKETDDAFRNATLLDRRDALKQQQELHSEYLKQRQAKAITGLVSTSAFTTSEEGMKNAVDVILGGLKDDDGVISEAVFEELTNQIELSNFSMVDALMDSGQLPTELYSKLTKAYDDQLDVQFNKSSQVYLRALEDAKNEITRMAKDPSVSSKELRERFNELDASLNFKPSDYGKLQKAIIEHPELVKNYVAPRTFAQKVAADELMAEIYNSIKQEEINKPAALRRVELNRRAGLITDKEARSLNKKINNAVFQSNLVKQDKKVRNELSKIDSLKGQLDLIKNNPNLTVKQKAGLVDDAKQQWIDENGKLIKKVKPTDSIKDLMAISERLLPDSPNRANLEELILQRELNNEIIGKIAVGQSSTKTALISKDQKAIAHNFLDTRKLTSVDQRVNVLKAAGASESMKDELSMLLVSQRSEEALTDAQKESLNDLSVYIEKFGDASAMKAFGLKGKEGLLLINSAKRFNNPEAVVNAFYVSKETSAIQAIEPKRRAKETKERFVKEYLKKGDQHGILASEMFDEIKQAYPDLSSKEISKIAEAELEESTVGGIVGMDEESLAETNYIKYLKDPSESIIEAFKEELRNKGMGESQLDSLDIEVSFDNNRFRVDYGNNELRQTVFLPIEEVDAVMEASEDYQSLLKERRDKQQQLNENLQGNYESAFDKLVKTVVNPLGRN